MSTVSNVQPPPDQADFERLVRDALSKCYDRVALETSPLAALLPPGGGEERSRAAQLRGTLERAIENLRPAGGEPRPGSPEWRPYLLLQGRYLAGVSLQDLEAQLCLSGRQMRREQCRALEAVAAELWDRFFPGLPAPARPDEQTEPRLDLSDQPLDETSFPVNPSQLDLAELLYGVAATLQRRAESEGALLLVEPVPPEMRVLADRVILRQALLAMLGYAMGIVSDGPVSVRADTVEDRAVVRVDCLAEDAELVNSIEADKSLAKARYWSKQIEAQLTSSFPGPCPGHASLAISLPCASQPLLLIVDDQETAFRMFQRYLSQTPLRLTGVADGRETVGLARRLQPQAITLDIMMPNLDGWEVLQNLKGDPATRHIPVIVCSVWEEPELANSLGAADFLKKPIMQKDLLAALARLHVLGT
jgi:CheY-like chemotaxis protein